MRPIRFQVMDARKLRLSDASVDCVIDKATVDAILCAKGGGKNVLRVAREVDRVLRFGGSFVIVSHINPNPDAADCVDSGCVAAEGGVGPGVAGLEWLAESVLAAFDWSAAAWTVDVHSVTGQTNTPHVYVLCKRRRAQTRSAAAASADDVIVQLHEH